MILCNKAYTSINMTIPNRLQRTGNNNNNYIPSNILENVNFYIIILPKEFKSTNPSDSLV